MQDGPPLRAIGAENFRNLRAVGVQLGRVNVLVGPNGAGKSNLLDVVAFLGDIVRRDLVPALHSRGGFDSLYFHGETDGPIRLKIQSDVTGRGAPSTPDEYVLAVRRSRAPGIIVRDESFDLKPVDGPGRRIAITVQGGSVRFTDGIRRSKLGLRSDSSALSTLPRLEQGGEEIARLAEMFATFRVFDVDVGRARQPSLETSAEQLEPDAANLASFLAGLRERNSDIFEELVDDAAGIIPGLREIKIEPAGGSGRAVAVLLAEAGLDVPTPLAYASFGTIRLLAILALLHDPNPPLLTCIEELDHGLHPYAFDRIVERIRIASRRTQFLIATHSPALVNRLDPSELIVCERDDTGASRIPAIDADTTRRIMDSGDLGRSGRRRRSTSSAVTVTSARPMWSATVGPR